MLHMGAGAWICAWGTFLIAWQILSTLIDQHLYQAAETGTAAHGNLQGAIRWAKLTTIVVV